MSDIRFQLAPAPPLDRLGRLWRSLDNDSALSFFVSWSWIGTWLRCLPGNIRPQLLTATRGDEVIGAAILVPRVARRWGLMRVRQLHFNATGDPALDSIWIEHNGFAGGAQLQHGLWPAFQGWFMEQREADEMLVPRADGTIVGPPAEMRLIHASDESLAFRCELRPGGADAILEQLSTNTRQQLRRSLRACGALGELRCEAAESVETALGWFDALKRLHVVSWEARGRPHAFRHSFAEAFHKALIAQGVPEGSVQVLRISAGTTVLGYLYNFRHTRTVSAYQSGFDYRLEKLRPGYVSHLLAMVMNAEKGANRYDFLAGDNQLKRSLGPGRYAISSHRLAKPRLGLRIGSTAKSLRKRLGL